MLEVVNMKLSQKSGKFEMLVSFLWLAVTWTRSTITSHSVSISQTAFPFRRVLRLVTFPIDLT